MRALTVALRTVQVLYDELFLMVWLSILWWLGALPMLLIVSTGAQIGLSTVAGAPTGSGTALVLFVALVLGVGIGGVFCAMATGGLHRVANRLANYRRVDSSFFWEGATTQVRRSWALLALEILLVAALLFNIVFYLSSPAQWMRVIGMAWIWVLLLGIMAIQYTFALFWQQDEPSLRLVARNALVLTLQHPLYTFTLLLIQLMWVAIAAVTVLPFFLLLPAALAVTANVGLVTLLQEKGLAPPPPPGV